jgi:hypothetical protein
MGLRGSAKLVVFAWLSVSGTAHAQAQLETVPPPFLAVVDGAVTLERDGQTETATPGMPYIAGDRLRTERGRVEIRFPDGSALDVDEVSVIDRQDAGLPRMVGGRVLLTAAQGNNSLAAQYQIDTPAGSAAIGGPGEYRVAVINGITGPQTELAVLRGSAALTTEFDSQPLRAGERSLASASGAPSYPQPFNAARLDAFDRWASAQRDLRLGSSASAQYLPSDLQMYGGTLDRNGSWAYDASDGNVWYPSVAPGWRPYYDGYWNPLPQFGWTWIGVNVWSWPTHHYGRWGYAHSRWFWIPGRQWAPAWVHWGAAPGYVGWCPLGFDNRPVFSLSASDTNHWANGWVVLPRPYFGAHGGYVRRYAVSPRMLPVNTPFVEHAAAPVLPRAVPHGSAGAVTTAPPRTAFERRYGAPPAPSTQPNAPGAPLRDDRAQERRPPSSAMPGRSFQAPQQVPMFGASRTTPEGAIRRRSLGTGLPSPVNAPRAAGTPSAVPRAATPRYAPQTERTSPTVAAPAPRESRGRAVPRSSSPSATPAPASSHAEGRAQGRDPSHSSSSGVSNGSAQGSHDAHSRRPR